MEENQKKLLIIEDSITVQQMERKFFLDQGFQVVCTANGEEGIELAKSEKPDFAIIDTILPGIDGYETCKKIKELEELNIKIIINSGNDNPEKDDIRAKEVGADTFIVKSSDFTPLLEAINKFNLR